MLAVHVSVCARAGAFVLELEHWWSAGHSTSLESRSGAGIEQAQAVEGNGWRAVGKTVGETVVRDTCPAAAAISTW